MFQEDIFLGRNICQVLPVDAGSRMVSCLYYLHIYIIGAYLLIEKIKLYQKLYFAFILQILLHEFLYDNSICLSDSPTSSDPCDPLPTVSYLFGENSCYHISIIIGTIIREMCFTNNYLMNFIYCFGQHFIYIIFNIKLYPIFIIRIHVMVEQILVIQLFSKHMSILGGYLYFRKICLVIILLFIYIYYYIIIQFYICIYQPRIQSLNR